LLPYGEQIKTNYKNNLCLSCKVIEQNYQRTITCPHPKSKKTEVPTYFPTDLEFALQEIVATAIRNKHYIDVFS